MSAPRRSLGWLGAAAAEAGRVLATLGGASLLMLWLVARAEGDAADLLAADPAQRAQWVAALRLEEPLLQRWLGYWGGALGGDLGVSWTVRPGEPVAALLGRAWAGSAPRLLGASALSLALGLGAAWVERGGQALRRVQRLVSVTPAFLLAWLLILGLNTAAFAGMQAGRLARPAWFALPDQDSALKTLLAVGVLAVGSSALSEVQEALRAELGRLRGAPFIEALRARGAPTRRALVHNLLPGAAAVLSAQAPGLVGGLVVVEGVLHLNGAGALLWQACRLRDLPLALGLTLTAAAAVCAARLVVDWTRLALDPRLREPA